jgi:hypothetical protein
MATAAALPPVGDDGGGGGGVPIERPTTTRPGPTPTTEPPRPLTSFIVTTDSVVATAVVQYDGAPGLVTVAWGDGTTSTDDPYDPIDETRPNPSPQPLGVVVLQHVYTPPPSGAAFTANVTAQYGGDTSTVAVTVTPRFRVTQYAATFRPLTQCDTEPELYDEWLISRDGPPAAVRTWDFDWIGQVPYTLPDSVLSFDLVAGADVQVGYTVTEHDLLVDDQGGQRTIDFDPALGSRSVRLTYYEFLPDVSPCNVEIRADVNVTLLEPGLVRGPVAGQ